jgi:hypothetical protein
MIRCLFLVALLAGTATAQTAEIMPLDPPALPEADVQQLNVQGPSEVLLTQGTSVSANSGGSAGGEQAGNGTNPAENARRFVLRNEYLELGSGLVVNSTIARLNLPAFGKKGGIGFELPFNYYDPTQPNIGQFGGIGDIKMNASYNFWTSDSKKLTLFGGADFWAPTADSVTITRNPTNNQLSVQDIGTGKYRAAPYAGFVYAFSATRIFAPLYQHEFSFAGDSSRQTIHRGVVRVFFMNAWESGIYVLPEAQMIIDYTNINRLDVFLAPEVGYSWKGTTLFGKPGFGINPGENNRYVGINFGLRQDF